MEAMIDQHLRDNSPSEVDGRDACEDRMNLQTL